MGNQPRGADEAVDDDPEPVEIGEMDDLAVKIVRPAPLQRPGHEQAGDDEEGRNAERTGKLDDGVQEALAAHRIADALG